MKIYMFYLDDLAKIDNGRKRLYAFTDKKELSDVFKEQRDMEKFMYIKEDMSKDEYRLLSDSYRKGILTKTKMKTKRDGKAILTDVVCTWSEEESVLKNSDRLWEENDKCLIDCMMLKDDYIKALEKILYIKFYGFYNPSITKDYYYEPYYSPYGPVEEFLLDEFRNEYNYDEFMLFLKFFKYTFK